MYIWLVLTPVVSVCLSLSLSATQQQSARFLGPPRERSPSLPGGGGGVLGPSSHQHCHTPANNNHPLHRPCGSCPDHHHCEHDAAAANKHFGPSPIFSESCRRYIENNTRQRATDVHKLSSIVVAHTGAQLRCQSSPLAWWWWACVCAAVGPCRSARPPSKCIHYMHRRKCIRMHARHLRTPQTHII